MSGRVASCPRYLSQGTVRSLNRLGQVRGVLLDRCRHYLPGRGPSAVADFALSLTIWLPFQRAGAKHADWHAIRIQAQDRFKDRGSFVEQLHHEIVAPPTVAALRGAGWSAPVWWEALDEEGSRRGGILQNPLPQSNRIAGVGQISVGATPPAHGLVIQDVAGRDLVPHSFPFLTGLCEKDSTGAGSLALLAVRYKRL